MALVLQRLSASGSSSWFAAMASLFVIFRLPNAIGVSRHDIDYLSVELQLNSKVSIPEAGVTSE